MTESMTPFVARTLRKAAGARSRHGESLPGFQSASLRRWCATDEDQTVDRCCGSTRHAMPVLHSRTHESGTPPRRDATGADGGHLGCGRDAGGRCLCAYRDLADRNG